MKLLIVQPWFTAIGHPAQSLLNTARVLGIRSDVGYLISDPGNGEFAVTASELEKYGSVERFNSRGDSLRTGTFLSLPAVMRVVRREAELQHVFFLDAHLVSLAVAWPPIGSLIAGFSHWAASENPGRLLQSRRLEGRDRRRGPAPDQSGLRLDQGPCHRHHPAPGPPRRALRLDKRAPNDEGEG